MEERLFNKELRRGRSIVKNAFRILKGVFRELRNVMETHVTILINMIVAYYLLHNLLLG